MLAAIEPRRFSITTNIDETAARRWDAYAALLVYYTRHEPQRSRSVCEPLTLSTRPDHVMSFDLHFPTTTDADHRIHLDPGDVLFVLGANGTGKSSLMFHFNIQHHGHTRRISAHRQTWMHSEALDMTPSAKVQTEQHIQNEDQNIHSRYRDEYAAQRASMTIYDLIDAENVRARAIAAAYDAGDDERLKQAGSVEAPVTVINELLRQSNVPITITIHANERVMASRASGPPYSAAQLSDGERNALLIAGNVLTAPEGTLLVIDEPERHLHRSIISPLLHQLFERRPDCSFVISTHDHDLPLTHLTARTLLLRSCTFNGPHVQSWDADELPAGSPIVDELRRDLLGARRTIFFVEGTESSLDKSLYSIVFPMVSVIPKGNCHEVEKAVVGARSSETLHWLRAFGIVDSDGLERADIAAKRAHGVYAVPFYSVEGLYFHPQMIRWVASRVVSIHGGDAGRLARDAIASGVAAIRGHTERLSRKVAKKVIRRSVIEQIPNDDNLMRDGGPIVIVNEPKAVHTRYMKKLESAVEQGDWETILTTCPVRESSALEEIAKRLMFGRRQDYERAVRHLLSRERDAREYIRALFGDLSEQIPT